MRGATAEKCSLGTLRRLIVMVASRDGVDNNSTFKNLVRHILLFGYLQ
jgi:hypothetical protein